MNHSPIPMRNDLLANESKGFFIQESRIQVGRILFLDTKCSWKFYYSQNFLLNRNKLCGCFILKSNRSNIISMNSICVSTDSDEINMMRKFRSLNVLDTFKKGNLSVDIRASRMQSGNYAYEDTVYVFDKIIDLVNSEGG